MIKDFLNHRKIRKIGKYADLSLDDLSKKTALALYRQMLRLRITEVALLEEYHPADEMRCPVHFCIGQESVPSALSLLCKHDDYLFSHHRSHGYYFGKNAPLKNLFAEIYGRSTGASGGKAGSQDISHPESHFYSGAILAGATSIAVGAALGFQLAKSKQIAIAGCGEGATDEGAFWEAMNYAGNKNLPILFIIENNRYATFSDQLSRQNSDNISERVSTFGVRATKIFGNDSPLAYTTIKKELVRLREGDGPALVEAYTYRWNSHVGPEDDSVNNYRKEEEIAFWKSNCPILILEEKLFKQSMLTEELKAQYIKEIDKEIEGNFKFAKESPFPEHPDWQSMNYNDASPLADKLLASAAKSSFDYNQAETKLGPY